MLAGRSFAGRAVCCLLLFPFTKKTAPLFFFFSMSDATMRELAGTCFQGLFFSFPFPLSLLSPFQTKVHQSESFFPLQILFLVFLKHTLSLTLFQSQSVSGFADPVHSFTYTTSFLAFGRKNKKRHHCFLIAQP